MNLSQYLNIHNIHDFEGHSQQIPDQIELLNELSSNATSILEIGFNVGHSSELFLSTHPNRTVISFDIGLYKEGFSVGKRFLDFNYPNRHTLILGDSQITLPEFIHKTDNKFDLIFIDGGHHYNISKSDLLNCKNLAHKDTLLILDDTVFTPGWEKEYTIGPTKVWLEFVSSGFISELGRVEFEKGRGMSWGHYVFN